MKSMRPAVGTVKGSRTYDATGRRARAEARREAALRVAADSFLGDGYAATTVDRIAEAAGVSAATIYKTYGGKAGLVRTLCERALAGEGPTPAEERSDALRARAAPRQIVEGWGRLLAEVAPRVAPLLLVLREARADPDAAALYEALDAARLARMDDNAVHLLAAGRLREGVSQEQARDVLWLSTSPELYDLLVNQRGWTTEAFSRFVTDLMAGALLPGG
jgi:AcrR family transcriptional regulator